MSIPAIGSTQETAAISKVAEVAPAAAATSAAATAQQAPGSPILGPALEAIRQLPEIDQAQVASLRDALQRGEIPFDASKLASLIERYHRSGE